MESEEVFRRMAADAARAAEAGGNIMWFVVFALLFWAVGELLARFVED
jgi:hypothetical protein